MGQLIAKPALYSSPNDDKKKPGSNKSQTKSQESSDDGSTPNFAWLENRRFMYINGIQTVMPQDHEERGRELRLHLLLREAKGNFLAPVQEQMKEGVSVLDCGCGGGYWTMELASEYPRSKYIGVDISPEIPKTVSYPNCIFSTGNVLEKLAFTDETFDFVYQRSMAYTYTEDQWPLALRELYRVLKPGGYIELLEQDIFYHRLGPEAKDFSGRFIMALQARGLDVAITRQLPSLLRVAGFTLVSSSYVSLPLNWGGDQGISNALDKITVLRSVKPWLAPMLGFSDDDYVAATARISSEWTRFKAYGNYHTFVAQKS